MATHGVGERKLQWGCYGLPEQYASGHFLFLGATGSGKTVLIKMLMKSLFRPDGTTVYPCRSVVYDAKGDFYSLLCALGLKDKVDILHPFDKRGVAWDLAKDACTPVLARQIASILLPHADTARGTDRFFTDAVRDLATATMVALQELHRENWTFRHLLLLLLNSGDLSTFLERSQQPGVRRAYEIYLGKGSEERTRSNIMATASAALSVYEPIAAAWEKRREQNRPVSVRDWVSSDRIILLGNDETARESLDAVNRAIFQRIVDEVLDLPEIDTPRGPRGQRGTPSYFFLDEVREAGRLDGLRRLLNKGRSKGSRVVLGCQDIEGLQAVYGPHEGKEMLAQCSNVIALNLVSPETAEWATGLFGEVLMDVRSSSDSRRPSDLRQAQQSSDVRPVVTTQEVLTMRRIHPSTGLSGFYRSLVIQESEALRGVPPRDRISPWMQNPERWTWDAAVKSRLPETSPEENFIRSDPADQLLQPWGDTERKAFLPGKPGPPDKPTLPKRDAGRSAARGGVAGINDLNF